MHSRSLAAIAIMILLPATAAPAGAAAPVSNPPGQADVTVHVNAGNPLGPFKRALLGWTDMWSLLGTTGLGWNAYALSNPSGTLQRQGVDLNALCPTSAGTCAGGQGLQWNAMFDWLGTHAPFTGTTPDELLQKMVAYGEKPELLFSGRADLFQNDPQAWANLVAQVLQHVEDGDGIPVPAIEVWNEPNCCGSQPGTLQQYATAFRVTSQTIHARFPNVLVAGPVYCCDNAGNGRDPWPFAFLQQDGAGLDAFVWHDYGGHPLQDIAFWMNVLENQFHIAHPKVMVTESDWGNTGSSPTGYAKNELLLRRTFGLIPYAQHIVSWDQFHLGTYAGFGLINNDGTVVDKNYWPYWIFRDAEGDRVQTGVSVRPGSAAAGNTNDAVGTAAADGRQVNVVFYEPSTTAAGSAATPETVRFHVNLPSDAGWTYNVSVLSPTEHDVAQSGTVPAGTAEYDGAQSVMPGEALSITFRPARTPAVPYIDLSVSGPQAPLGATFTGDARVFNTGGRTLTGTLGLLDLPSGWTSRFQGGPEFSLAPGQSADMPFSVAVPASTAPNRAFVFAAQATYTGGAGGQGSFISLPAKVTSVSPVALYPIPDYTLIAPGETRSFGVSLTDALPTPVTVSVYSPWPTVWPEAGTERQTLTLQPGVPVLLHDTLTAPTATVTGATYTVPVQVSLDGNTLPPHNVQIQLADYNPLVASTPVDIASLYNGDGFSFDANPGDGNLDGGGYTLPADDFPANQQVRYDGVLFQTPNTADGVDNEVQWAGQTVRLPAGTVAHGLGLLIDATNGNQTADLTLMYGDGATQTVTQPVEDWCGSITLPLPGNIPVIHFDHRHHAGNSDAPPACGVWYVQVPVNPASSLSSVTLGANGNLHLFGLSTIR